MDNEQWMRTISDFPLVNEQWMRTGQALSLVHLRPPKGLEHDDTSRLPCKSTLSPLVFAQKNILQQKKKEANIYQKMCTVFIGWCYYLRKGINIYDKL